MRNVISPPTVRIFGLNPTRGVEVYLVLSLSVLLFEWKEVHSLESQRLLSLVNMAINFLLREFFDQLSNYRLSKTELHAVRYDFQNFPTMSLYCAIRLVSGECKFHSPNQHEEHFQYQYY